MLHVVHLEDDSPLRDILQEAMRLLEPDIHLVQFINSDRALEYIQQNAAAIDLLIFDIRVPGSMDGMGLAQKVRAGICDAPIVVTSAFSPPKRDLLNMLRCEWVSKPWQFITFRSNFLELAKQHQLNRQQKPLPPQ
jgi:CheY-like chemotaxis protein